MKKPTKRAFRPFISALLQLIDELQSSTELTASETSKITASGSSLSAANLHPTLNSKP